MKQAIAILAICIGMAACATVETYRTGTATWQELALSSCQDAKLAGTAASAAVAWSKIYFPNQADVFTSTIDPILTDVSAGVDTYCAAANAVQGVDGLQALLAKKSELLTLVDKLSALVAKVKGS